MDNTLIGNGANNTLSGGSGNDLLNGGAGTDTMQGGIGNDIYVVDSAADAVSETAGEGIDLVRSTASYALGANVENLTLFGTDNLIGNGNGLDNTLIGNAGSNTLSGGAGNDTINGGAGSDTLQGGAGDDIYTVDDAGDVVLESANEGVDLVRSSINYTLNANLENLTLIGTDSLSGIGNSLNNTLVGNSGANVLNGGAGNDTMVGSAGDDTYVVDSAGDVATEAASAGTDLVLAGLNWTLATNLENLTLTGTANLNGTGNTLANTLRGNTGNNALNGGAGNDTMIGGAGDDSYTVDSASDVITELANEGTDTVSAGVTYTLAANVEHLTLTGTTVINGTGNTLDNRLTGNSVNNNLSGGAGNDTIDGGTGNDTMVGGAGDDTFVVNAATDVVTEAANEGTDTVQSAVTLTLGNNVENLTLTGTTAINGTGNTLNNVLTGNSAANILAGAAGNDTYIGGAGNDILNDNSTTSNDTYRWGVGQGNDNITDAGGSDRIEIAAGVTASQVSLVRSGNNLQVRISGATDVLSVVNWYTATANRAETIALADGTIINAGTVAPLSVVAPASRESMAMRVRGPVDATRAMAWATNLDGDRGARLLVEAMAQFDGRTTGSETIERVRRPDILRIDLASPM